MALSYAQPHPKHVFDDHMSHPLCFPFQAYYKAQCLIGQGTYGNVYKCKVQVGHATQWSSNEESIVAVKKFKKAILVSDNHSQRRRNKCKRELHMLKLFSENPHPHVVRLLDFFYTQGGKLCLVFEYIDRTLLQVLDGRPTGIRENDTKRIIWQLLDGLKELHSRNIMHRDIKPENILINRHGIVKICDLGFARYDPSPEDVEDGMSEEMTQYISTRWYRAPELLLRHSRYTKAVDVWSIGCLVVELLSGTPAFPGKTDLGVLGMILEVLGDCTLEQGQEHLQNVTLEAAHGFKKDKHTIWLKQWQKSVPKQVRSFVSLCLKTNPKERATVEDLLSHEWLTTAHPEWQNESFKSNLHNSLIQTKSIHATVMACKRLRMATTQDGGLEKQNCARRASTKDFILTACKNTPVSPLLPLESRKTIKHGYYTPQIERSKEALEPKDQGTRYWLETPGGGGMMSPKLNENSMNRKMNKVTAAPAGPSQEIIVESNSILREKTGNSEPRQPLTESPAKHQKRTIAKKLGGMIHKIFQ